MAVHLVDGVEKLIDKGAGQLVQKVVATARGFAPVESGYLAGSISGHKIGIGSYEVSTNAVGRNGFAYPAHIEAGEGVHATNSKDGLLHFVINGDWIVTHSTAPSEKPHFMRKTVRKYGGR